ncbi:uncharacterized protein [Prorops nasuta]|uniref:uncharacterized protein n=1 Tax=Prorops nasuta TaxID=863751 RepID=UPI0034CFD930
MDQYYAHNRYVDLNKYSWTIGSTKLLLEHIRKNKNIIQNKNIGQKKLWEVIAAELGKKGYLVNGKQCSNKWKSFNLLVKPIAIGHLSVFDTSITSEYVLP